MTHIALDPCEAGARFHKNELNQACIEFLDPAYARADMILFEPSTRSVHALLHEGMFALGTLPLELEECFGSASEIMLCADHYAGHRVGLRAPVSIV